ncbi:zinc knuckle CX2CX4HX4C containing protein [Tanacetum coccineum]
MQIVSGSSKTHAYSSVVHGANSTTRTKAISVESVIVKRAALSPDLPIGQSVFINTKPVSYAKAPGASSSELKKGKFNFRALASENVCEGVKLSIHVTVVETGSSRLRILFMATLLANGLHSWLWSIINGLKDVLENGPWMIRKNPIILKKWTMNTSMLKEEFTHVPVWVILYDIPLQVFSKDGISLIATKIGTPLVLDSYTSSMHIDYWGRSSFSRCLIKVKVGDVALKESITMRIPLLKGSGFFKKTVCVEYEWKPPRKIDFKRLSSKEGVDGDIPRSSNVNQPAKTGGTSSNPFDALNSVKNYDELCTNEGNSKLCEASGSLTTTPLTKRINNIVRQVLVGKLVLVEDDGKPLKRLILWLI